METVKLTQYPKTPNCSLINWSYPALMFSNEIRRVLSKYDLTHIRCYEHTYIFNALPHGFNNSVTFSFEETDMLMQLVPGESVQFYLRAALREFTNNFEVYNCKGARVYPEDIPDA